MCHPASRDDPVLWLQEEECSERAQHGSFQERLGRRPVFHSERHLNPLEVKSIWKAMRSKSKSLAGQAAVASTTQHFALHTPLKHILVIVRSLALFEIPNSPFLLEI